MARDGSRLNKSANAGYGVHTPLTVREPLWLDSAGHFARHTRHHVRDRRRDDFHVILVLDGRGRVEKPGNPVDVSRGDVIGLWQGKHHTYRSDPERPWTVRWVHFAGRAATSLMQSTGFAPGRTVLRVSDARSAEAAHERVLANLYEKKAGYQERAGAHLYMMMTEIRCARLSAEVSDARTPAVAAMEFFNERLADDVSLEDAARHCGLSPFHFSRVFKAAIGMSPMAWFASLRVARAKELLRAGQLRVKEVASLVGYKDEYYFMRVFKKHTGLTPHRFSLMHTAESV